MRLTNKAKRRMGAVLARSAYEKYCWHCPMEHDCNRDVINVKQIDHCIEVAAGRRPSVVDL